VLDLRFLHVNHFREEVVILHCGIVMHVGHLLFNGLVRLHLLFPHRVGELVLRDELAGRTVSLDHEEARVLVLAGKGVLEATCLLQFHVADDVGRVALALLGGGRVDCHFGTFALRESVIMVQGEDSIVVGVLRGDLRRLVLSGDEGLVDTGDEGACRTA